MASLVNPNIRIYSDELSDNVIRLPIIPCMALSFEDQYEAERPGSVIVLTTEPPT